MIYVRGMGAGFIGRALEAVASPSPVPHWVQKQLRNNVPTLGLL